MSLFTAYTRAPVSSSTGNFTIGVRFQVRSAGNVTAFRLYKTAGNTGDILFSLWSDAGSLLASATRPGDSVNGWVEQSLVTPYALTTDTYYRVAWYTGGNGRAFLYDFTQTFFYDIYNPIVIENSAQRYSGGNAFPNTYSANEYDAINIVFESDYSAPTAQKAWSASPGVNGAFKSIRTAEGELKTGIRKELVEGHPTAPSMAIDFPNTWRFRWGVKMGTRTISIMTKQVSNVAGKRPRMRVIANPEIGVNVDVAGDAPAGTDWVTIGPLTVNPVSDGVLWVELENRDTDNFNSPAYFDHRIIT